MIKRITIKSYGQTLNQSSHLQIVQVLSLLAVTIVSPVYENAQLNTSSTWPSSFCTQYPDSRDHKRAVLSREEVKRWWPLGLKQTGHDANERKVNIAFRTKFLGVLKIRIKNKQTTNKVRYKYITFRNFLSMTLHDRKLFKIRIGVPNSCRSIAASCGQFLALVVKGQVENFVVVAQ